MDLYFAPFSCSLATRIALYESGQEARFHRVSLMDKTLMDGSDYLAINPKGQVPALRLEDGTILTEGPAILQYVADLAPQSGLAPAAGSVARYQLQSWLNYVASEVHKQIFYSIFNPAAPDEAKAFARSFSVPTRFAHLSAHLEANEFLTGDSFTVADAYLAVMLNLAGFAGIEMTDWPVLAAWQSKILARPAVARAFADDAAAQAAG